MSTITNSFSGVVINQNAVLDHTSLVPVVQSFTLPADYIRGSFDPVTGLTNQIIPDLTGFQVFAYVTDPDTASVTWSLEVDATVIGSGTTTGTATYGNVWFKVIFDDSIPVDSDWLTATFILTITPSVPLGYSAGPALMYRILAAVADSGTDFLGNVYRAAVLESVVENVDVVGSDDVFSSWMSNPCPSQFGVEALYMDVRQGTQPAVIDRLTIDPMTPGVSFHVYYSNDPTGPGTDTTSWEQLLWTPVYQTYTASRMQTFVLPEPVTANFFCIEFTDLQQRSYNPNNFQLPTTYKKYPKWVLDYFIGLYQLNTMDRLSSAVNVTYDALDLGYSYHSSDIIQQPDPPVLAQTPVSSLSQFIGQQTYLDPQTLSQISLNFQPYQTQPALMGDSDSILGQYAASTAPGTYPTEVVTPGVGNTSYVSNLQRDALLVEKGFPSMFFYIPSRHSFKIAQANFSTNIAYFAGVKQLVLHRDVYTSYADQTQYNENLGDGTNLLWNDWDDPVAFTPLIPLNLANPLMLSSDLVLLPSLVLDP